MMRAIGRQRPPRLVLAALVAATALATDLALTSPAEGPEATSAETVLRQSGAADTSARQELEAVPADYPLEDGHFYSQGAAAGNRLFGYTVAGAMAAAHDAAGGMASLGFPISQAWTDEEGRSNQAFQRALLRVTTANGNTTKIERVAVLPALITAGKGEWLAEVYQVPPATELTGDQRGQGEEVEKALLALLAQDDALRQAFLTTVDWRERFGLPLALGRTDRVVTLQAERAILRRWLIDVPEAAAGTVVAIDGAILAKESGLVPASAARPIVSPRFGWLAVSGRQIVDGQGKPVRLSGVNWTGFELVDFAPRGLDKRDYTGIVDSIAALGFNTIRLPFSNEMIERNPVPKPPIVAACPSCQGKTALEIMDMIVDYAGQKGLRVILDNHFSHASGFGIALWYTEDYPDEVWVKHWQVLAERYKGNPVVVGFDLRNEPHGPATWGSGNAATDFRLAAERAGKAILAINPHLLIIVEGIELFPKPGGGTDAVWWGGNLRGVRDFPVRLPAANLVYSPHDYGPTLYAQSWFNPGTTAQSLLSVWQKYWAYLNLDLDQPLLIGEFGTGNAASDISTTHPGMQGQWFQSLIALIRQRDNLHWVYWAIDDEDQFSLLDKSYSAVANPEKLAALESIMGPRFPAMSGARQATETVDIGGELAVRAR